MARADGRCVKRSGIKRRRPEKLLREPFVCRTSPGPPVTADRRVAGVTEPPAIIPDPRPKATVVKSRLLRDSARGERCTLCLPRVCNQDPATTVLAHLPSEIKASKSTDLSSAFACSACHDVTDGRARYDWGGMRDWYLRRAMVRTWTRWTERGLITIRGRDE